jgi:hypothetical protein
VGARGEAAGYIRIAAGSVISAVASVLISKPDILARACQAMAARVDRTTSASGTFEKSLFNFRNKRCCQSEQYLVVHASRFHPQINDAEEAMVLDRISLVETVHDASERLTPLSLANIVESYLREGAPIELPDVEVLIDCWQSPLEKLARSFCVETKIASKFLRFAIRSRSKAP